MLPSVAIHRLTRDDVPAVVRLLATADDADRRHFTPFEYTHESVDAVISRMTNDAMFGVAVERSAECRDWIAFYMLRGLDEGYASPMYGVFVAPAARRLGIASFTIRHAITFCKVNRLPSLLLKVYPSNQGAVSAYASLGFKPLREQPPQIVMELPFETSPALPRDQSTSPLSARRSA